MSFLKAEWRKLAIANYEIAGDYGKVYGNDFEFLNRENPKSVMLAEGSLITVENKRRLKKNV